MASIIESIEKYERQGGDESDSEGIQHGGVQALY